MGTRAPAAMIHSGHGAGRVGIHFHREHLPLAIEHGLSREKNVGAEDAIELLLVEFARGTGRTAQIDRDHRLVHQDESTELEAMRDGDAVEAAVDPQAKREFG